jgi:signal transduction histidine kinase
MRQVWANLLSNAVKYSRAADVPTIEVGCRVEAGTQICHVRDNGIGFPMDEADKLFQVFSRLHPGPEFEGTGIGLAIVRRVIERHGGKVWAESKPGRGSTFYFSIPDPESRAGSSG